ncbi:hypothetical protein BX600DRAFT_474854 [Xylariales sp. PMI_506]|nr:hypothetical protein BX600DRAFT_474854 [Xylariales sp. PMI_506]
MTRWHRKTCRFPDVNIAGGVPYCSSCDSLAPVDDIQPVPAVKVRSSRSTMAKIRLIYPAYSRSTYTTTTYLEVRASLSEMAEIGVK